MKKFAKWFFGIDGEMSSPYVSRIEENRCSAYNITKHAVNNLTYCFDLLTVALFMCNLCGVIHIDWIFVFLPIVIRTAINFFDDCIDSAIVKAKKRMREEAWERHMKEERAFYNRLPEDDADDVTNDVTNEL